MTVILTTEEPFQMIRALTAVVFTLALAPPAALAATCAGANPAITSVVVKNVTNNGLTNTYHMVGTVSNLGSAGQPSNTLQFVDIYVDRVKHDDRGIPPLAPGQSYTFGYDWVRSVDAGPGTTTVHFRIRMVQGSDCNPANGTNSVTF
jgi:CARDB